MAVPLLVGGILVGGLWWNQFPSGVLRRDDSDAPGKFLDLTNGRTHYVFYGEEEERRPLVVMIHGISGCIDAFGSIPQMLFEQGFRVLLIDIYGRGYSDAPDLPQISSLFVQQLYDAVIALNIRESFTLVGWSMGGAIATLFSVQHNDFVSKLVLVAPAGLAAGVPIDVKIISQLPSFIRSPIVKLTGKSMLLKFVNQVTRMESWGETYRESMKIRVEKEPGLLRSIMSSMVNFPLYDTRSDIAALNGLSTPVLLLWGTKDSTTPYEAAKEFVSLIPRTQLVTLDTGHIIPGEKPEEMSHAIVEFANQ